MLELLEYELNFNINDPDPDIRMVEQIKMSENQISRDIAIAISTDLCELLQDVDKRIFDSVLNYRESIPYIIPNHYQAMIFGVDHVRQGKNPICDTVKNEKIDESRMYMPYYVSVIYETLLLIHNLAFPMSKGERWHYFSEECLTELVAMDKPGYDKPINSLYVQYKALVVMDEAMAFMYYKFRQDDEIQMPADTQDNVKYMSSLRVKLVKVNRLLTLVYCPEHRRNKTNSMLELDRQILIHELIENHLTEYQTLVTSAISSGCV